MFKVGDEVKLSDSGVATFSKNDWAGYSIPLAIHLHGGVVTNVVASGNGENKVFVSASSGSQSAWFYEEDLILLNVNEERADEDRVAVAVSSKEEEDTEYTGGSSSYYKVYVKHPTTLGEPYEAECNDIIEALNMTFAEGNAFKAIWRKAKARQGVKKKGYDNGVYDSEKVVFFGKRMLVEAKDES